MGALEIEFELIDGWIVLAGFWPFLGARNIDVGNEPSATNLRLFAIEAI